MRIGTVAKEAGVGVETIRFYERKGLIAQPPKPAEGVFRQNSPEVVVRILFIRQAQALGFSLNEIEELLHLRTEPSTDCADIRTRAEKKLLEVNRKIGQLVSIQNALQTLIHACPGQGRATECCSILGAMDPSRDEEI
ncbi:MAG: MerR family DNA-binding protein [Gammaproteobacteria bacterium]|nr:MerR family DNA-binding protein [Gammaproteobacteria bacterium]